MNNAQRRKEDKLGREDTFISDNAVDFPAGSPVAVLTEQINVERQKILQFDAQQLSGFAGRRQAQEIYENRRDELIDLLDNFALAASIVDDDIEGTGARFKNQYPRTDQVIIARATSFKNDSASLKTELVDAGLEADDFAALLTIRDAFQQAATAHDSSEEQHAEASGGLTDSFHRAMDLSNRRSKRVKMKYRNNPSKLAAWTVASHLDRAPKAKAPTEPAPTP